ncbi:VacJ family lipoprotein [Nitrospirillum sp. BR 11828]|uniref:MlaA family lipoprotein n=1 Tax=Nitrospirillum sp. BR 11828 TaxID=3104325 RepID=UPI002ACA233A|nr:VacJ family lipoprotein [Nitrospirillum sp. BR 11828]MDZ5646070.1 VacJ family lipoprotein [Nitrospirillum sp. BR 11828]
MALLGTSACAHKPDSTPAQPALAGPEANDPLEGMNRGVFWFNDQVDQAVLRPVAQAYRWAIPPALRDAVSNVLNNVRSPLTLANNLLQGDFEGAGVTVERFVINSTVGIGGLVDVAAANGIPYHYQSLSQTFAVWGIDEGPYLVLPFLGASSVRDAAGFGLEAWGDPVTRVASNTNNDWANYTRVGLTVLDARSTYFEALDDLRKNSVDYYAAIRAAYRQQRDGYILNGKADPRQYPTIPDYSQNPDP